MNYSTAETTPPHEANSIIVKFTGPDGCPRCQAAGAAVTEWRISTRNHTTQLANTQEVHVQCTSCQQTRVVVRQEPTTLGKILFFTQNALATAVGHKVSNNGTQMAKRSAPTVQRPHATHG